MKQFRAQWAAGLVVAVAAAVDSRLLFSHGVPLGRYGYYFVLQTDRVAHRGIPAYFTPTPLYFYIAAPLRWLCGSPVIAVKTVALGAALALAFGLYALLRNLTTSAWAGVLAAAVVTFGMPQRFLLGEFPDELLSLALLAWAGALLAAEPGRRRCGQVLLFLAVLAHPVGLMLALGGVYGRA